jgi:hypothetical protein
MIQLDKQLYYYAFSFQEYIWTNHYPMHAIYSRKLFTHVLHIKHFAFLDQQNKTIMTTFYSFIQ